MFCGDFGGGRDGEVGVVVAACELGDGVRVDAGRIDGVRAGAGDFGD